MSVPDEKRQRLARLSKTDLIDEVLRLDLALDAAEGRTSPGSTTTAAAALRLSGFLDSIPAFVNVKDADGRYLFVNRYQAETMGIPARDQLGKTTAETVSREHFDRFNEIDRRVVKTGETISGIETRLVRPSGEVIWLNTHKVPVLDAEGRPMGIISVGIDVTAERKAERALEESRSLLQQVIDAAPVVLTVKDQNGRYVYANRFAAENLSLDPGDMVGKHVRDILPTEMVEEVLENDAMVFRTGDPIPFFDEVLDYGGADRWMMTSKTPFRDETGDVCYVVTVAVDLTEMKEAQRKLLEVEARFSSLVGQSPMAINLKDLDGRFVMANQPFVDMFHPGATEKDLLGKTIYDFASKQHADRATKMDRWVVETREALTEELTEAFDNGTSINTLVHKFPLVDTAGATIAIGTFITDITEIAVVRAALISARDAAEAASRAKSQFLANMSHELRTPLNSIIGFSTLIADPNFGPDIDEQHCQYAGDIRFSGTHLLEVINDILDVARIEAGTMTLQEASINVAALVAQCVGLIAESAARSGIDIDNATVDGLSPLIADDRQLRQVLLNLLSNAVKFTPPEGQIKVAAMPAGHGGLDISVSDNGIGIAAEELARVTEPFQQVGDIMTRPHEGSGLGLYLARAMVEAHGGELVIDSEVGVGTTVTARFPSSRMVEG